MARLSPASGEGGGKTSAADLKSLTHPWQDRVQGLQIESGTRIIKFASAHDFPKFVNGGSAMEHELRKVGTSGIYGSDAGGDGGRCRAGLARCAVRAHRPSRELAGRLDRRTGCAM